MDLDDDATEMGDGGLALALPKPSTETPPIFGTEVAVIPKGVRPGSIVDRANQQLVSLQDEYRSLQNTEIQFFHAFHEERSANTHLADRLRQAENGYALSHECAKAEYRMAVELSEHRNQDAARKPSSSLMLVRGPD